MSVGVHKAGPDRTSGASPLEMLSVNGESVYEFTEFFLIGASIPGILLIRFYISLSQRCNSHDVELCSRLREPRTCWRFLGLEQ